MSSHAATSSWTRYFLPAMTFMSVVIGGGYATGRELAEFFMPAGPVGGLLGMLVTAIVWSVVFALSLELARVTQSFDYRSFFKQLLGRGWVIFEAAYLALLLLVLAVVGAACGEIAAELLSAPPWTGTVAFIALIAALVWLGSTAIERFFSVWGLVLYGAYIVFAVVCLSAFSGPIAANLALSDSIRPGWIVGGLTYAGYNIAIAPALLFCARYQRRRRESLIAGALAGPIAIIPGVLLYITMLARFPEIAQAPIPLQVLLRALDQPWLAVGMQIAIFGTLVQTGVGVLHGFNERLLATQVAAPREHARRLRLGVSIALCVIAVGLATRIGLIDLIARGYGFIAWVMIAVYVVPLATVGVARIWRGVVSKEASLSAEPRGSATP